MSFTKESYCYYHYSKCIGNMKSHVTNQIDLGVIVLDCKRRSNGLHLQWVDFLLHGIQQPCPGLISWDTGCPFTER